MIELDNSRMNFLQQGRAAFNYRSMIVIFIAWCVFLGAVYGYGVLRQMGTRKDVVAIRATLERLGAEKDVQIRTLEAIGRERVGASVKQDLTEILLSRPLWSRVLRRLTRQLPPKVWLDGVHAARDKDGGYKLDIRGKAKSQRELTNFMMELDASGNFQRTELVGTKKIGDQDGVLEYDIATFPVLSRF